MGELALASQKAEPSRRAVLHGLGAAVSVAATGRLLLPGQVSARAKSISAPVFGANASEWNTVNSGLGGNLPAERCYAQGTSGNYGVPTQWFSPGSSVILVVGSFRPDIEKVLNGSLDAVLHAYAAKVPPDGIVTAWHEGEEPRLGHSAKEIQALHAYLAPIFHAAGRKYVQIVGSYSSVSRGKSLPSYISGHVDAVYLDGYGRNPSQTPEEIFGPPAEAITTAVGKEMPRGITETNSTVLHHRASWFASAWSYAVANQHEVFLTWWRAGGDLAWVPTDSSTIAELKELVSESGS